MTERAKTVAVIVTWNGRALLERLIESLKRTAAPLAGTVVVDNAGEDGTREMVAGKYPEINLITLEENIGYSAGVNAGVERARELGAEYVWVFNNDVAVEPGCLESLLDAMERNPSLGVVGPLVLDYATGEVAHRGYKINLYTGVMKEIASPDDEDAYEVDSAFGCSNLIRMKVADDIGGFDPAYNVYFDETDFNVRARRAGWKVAVVPKAKVRHEESATMNRFIFRKAALLLRNLLRFERKNASSAQLATFYPYFVFVHLPLFLLRGIRYYFQLRSKSSEK